MAFFEIVLLILAGLALLVIGYVAGKRIGQALADRRWQKELPIIRQDAAKRSRAVLGGQFSEQLAPFLPDFPFHPSEVKFLGKPVDFIVFRGLDEKAIEEVVFVEVKSGSSRLSVPERSLKLAIQQKRVSWQEYHIPEEITKPSP